jgi:hypothetical protein
MPSKFADSHRRLRPSSVVAAAGRRGIEMPDRFPPTPVSGYEFGPGRGRKAANFHVAQRKFPTCQTTGFQPPEVTTGRKIARAIEAPHLQLGQPSQRRGLGGRYASLHRSRGRNRQSGLHGQHEDNRCSAGPRRLGSSLGQVRPVQGSDRHDSGTCEKTRTAALEVNSLPKGVRRRRCSGMAALAGFEGPMRGAQFCGHLRPDSDCRRSGVAGMHGACSMHGLR